MSASYCAYAPDNPIHTYYHDAEYGFPAEEEAMLFERLVLEMNQAGLSWELMLKKRENFRSAYAGFDVDEVAAFDEAERARLLADAGIIRNRLKVDAAIHNARQIVEMRASHGGFSAWLMAHNPRPHDEWTKLFRKTFKFTGPLVVEEFLLSTGYLPGAHTKTCPAFARIIQSNPPWLQAGLDHLERA